MDAITIVKPTGLQSPEQVPAAVSPRLRRPSLSVNRASLQQKDKRLHRIDLNTTEKLSETFQQYVDYRNVRLEFQVDEGTRKLMVKVVDEESGRVIREIPWGQMIRFAASIHEMAGVLFQAKI